jgi:hypothetical protein
MPSTCFLDLSTLNSDVWGGPICCKIQLRAVPPVKVSDETHVFKSLDIPMIADWSVNDSSVRHVAKTYQDRDHE